METKFIYRVWKPDHNRLPSVVQNSNGQRTDYLRLVPELDLLHPLAHSIQVTKKGLVTDHSHVRERIYEANVDVRDLVLRPVCVVELNLQNVISLQLRYYPDLELIILKNRILLTQTRLLEPRQLLYLSRYILVAVVAYQIHRQT